MGCCLKNEFEFKGNFIHGKNNSNPRPSFFKVTFTVLMIAVWNKYEAFLENAIVMFLLQLIHVPVSIPLKNYVTRERSKTFPKNNITVPSDGSNQPLLLALSKPLSTYPRYDH